MKKSVIIALVFCLLLATSGCGTKSSGTPAPVQTPSNTDVPENAKSMQYISREETKYAVTSMQKSYFLLDLRKTSDYDTGHIITAISADLDSAVSSNDDDTAIKNLESALKQIFGNNLGNQEDKLVLLCYSGKEYAEKGTELLKGMGVASNRIFILEGGYKGWTNEDTYGEYQYLIDAVGIAKEKGKPNEFSTDLFRVPREGDFYITPEQLKTLIEAEAKRAEAEKLSDYYVIDARHIDEYVKGHVVGSVQAASFAVPDKNIFLPREQVYENLKNAFEQYPYENGKKLILICRGGKGGAQHMDDVLREMLNIDNSLILTMSYGFGAFPESWSKLGGDYTKYIISGDEPGIVADIK